MRKAVGFALGILICVAGSRIAMAADYGAQATPAVPSAPIPPAEAPRQMTLPDGFKATLFAGEPDVVQPIAFTFDDRGRLWVVECLRYPELDRRTASGKRPHRHLRRHRRRRPLRQAHRLLRQGREPLRHRTRLRRRLALLDAEPALHPRPRRRRQARRPAARSCSTAGALEGQAQRLQRPRPGARTAGSTAATASIATSQVGKPGTPDEQAACRSTAASGATTRRSKTFEVVAHGTTNPWGLDFDDYGEMFITNCVIDHLFHVVPGGHYQRMYGQDFNPHALRPDGELRRPHPLGRRRLDRLARRQGQAHATPAAATPTSAA